ncbi:hypothetical protein ACTA71_005029 [Dictyostelium dimigraforme]
MQDKEYSFEIINFKNEKHFIPEFTNKLVGLNENFTTFKPIIFEKYLAWARSIEETLFKTNGTIKNSIFEDIFSYCGYIGELMGVEPFFIFLKFTTLGIILDDFVFEKINLLNMDKNEKEQFIKSLNYNNNNYNNNNNNNNNNYNKLAFKFWKIIKQFEIHTHQISFERIVNAYSLWIKSSIESRDPNFKINSNYSFNDYFEKRSSDVCGDFILTLSMIGIKDQCIDSTIIDSKEYQIVNFHAKSFFLLVNDLYSFKREMNENDLLNYIKILAIQLNSIQLSIEKTIELIIDHYLKLLSSIEIILKLYEKNILIHELLKQVFGNVKKVISGIYYAHKKSKRYN